MMKLKVNWVIKDKGKGLWMLWTIGPSGVRALPLTNTLGPLGPLSTLDKFGI